MKRPKQFGFQHVTAFAIHHTAGLELNNMDTDNTPKTITVRFENEEDLREFAKRVEQLNISCKTTKIMFPKNDKSQGSLFD